MARDTSFDGITDDLIERYVAVLSRLNGWGSREAVYNGLIIPQEPFPAAYVYLSSQPHDYAQGTSFRRDINNVVIRILGGPETPGYKANPWRAAYSMVTAVVNELDYRPYLQDPTTTNNDPFRYIVPEGQLQVGMVGRIQSFPYSDQGMFIGIEIPTTVTLAFNIGRIS